MALTPMETTLGDRVLVNLAHVASVTELTFTPGCKLYMVDGTTYAVRQGIEWIKAKAEPLYQVGAAGSIRPLEGS